MAMWAGPSAPSRSSRATVSSSKTWLTRPESLVQREAGAIAGGDSGRLLAAVLQRVQANVGEAGHRLAGGVDADHAALLARAVGIEDGQRREVLGGRVPWRVRRHHPRGAWGTAR